MRRRVETEFSYQPAYQPAHHSGELAGSSLVEAVRRIARSPTATEGYGRLVVAFELATDEQFGALTESPFDVAEIRTYVERVLAGIEQHGAAEQYTAAEQYSAAAAAQLRAMLPPALAHLLVPAPAGIHRHDARMPPE